jgi:hypothetical protein
MIGHLFALVPGHAPAQVRQQRSNLLAHGQPHLLGSVLSSFMSIT